MYCKCIISTILQVEEGEAHVLNIETHIGISCCLLFLLPPLGLAALISSLLAKSRLRNRQFSAAVEHARRARIISIISVFVLGLALIGGVFYVLSRWDWGYGLLPKIVNNMPVFDKMWSIKVKQLQFLLTPQVVHRDWWACDGNGVGCRASRQVLHYDRNHPTNSCYCDCWG